MNNQRPIFLFAFANDQDRSLRLIEEGRSIREILSPAHDQKRIEVLQLGHTTLDDIFSTFNRLHNRVGLFHYGGHSGEDFLHLEDTKARAQGLAPLMGMQENLKLVFLNGCANKQQVQRLFKAGVKVVIATLAAVEDQNAYLFSKTFYQALVDGKSIRQAFETAKAQLEAQKGGLNIQSCSSVVLPEEEDQSFPWGLYYQREEDLDWTIPQPMAEPADYDYFREVPLELEGVNKALVESTFEGMRNCDPYYEMFYQRNKNSFNRLQNELLDAFPSILSIQTRDLFTIQGKGEGRHRLKELSEAYLTLAKLLSAIALSNLWDATAEKACIVRKGYREDLRHFMQWSPATGSKTDYFFLVQTVNCIVQENGIEPYVTELLALNDQTNMEYFNAHRFLEQELRQRLLANNIPYQEVESLCYESELHLGELFKQAAFLCNYQLVSVKSIAVDLPRKEPQPTFVHQKAILKGRDYATIDVEPMRRDDTSSNNSVFITRNLEEEGLPLNLSPFLIDQNAYKAKKQYLPKIYFFMGAEGEKLHFEHAENKENEFVISRHDNDKLYRNLESIFVLFDLFQEDLNLIETD